LRQAEAGIWATASSPDVVSYPTDGNERMRLVEDRSFWFQHRNKVILAALNRFPWEGCLIDVGGGNGFQAAAIQERFSRVMLLEPGSAGCRYARQRGVLSVVRGNLSGLGLESGHVGGLAFFDVLEHLADSDAILAQSLRLLRPGGRLYITVPNHEWLWSGEDAAAGHQRRYTSGALIEQAERAGFSVEFMTAFFQCLVIPILLFRTLPYRLGPGGVGAEGDHSPLLAAALRPLLDLELRRLRGGARLSWGSSLLMVCRKPTTAIAPTGRSARGS
jgi:SAM-dependent methyltransferase